MNQRNRMFRLRSPPLRLRETSEAIHETTASEAEGGQNG